MHTRDIDEKVFFKQVEGLYDNLKAALFAVVFNTAILLYVLHDRVNHQTLYSWGVAIILIATIRYGVYLWYRRSSSLENSRFFYRMFLGGFVVTAVLLGSSAYLIYPESSVPHGMLLIFLMGGMAAGAVASSAYRIEAYVTYVITVLSPFTLKFFMAGTETSFFMGVTLLLFMIMLLFLGSRYYQNQYEMIRLNYENEDLIGFLSSEKEKYKQITEELSSEISEHEKTQEHLATALEQAKQAAKAKDAFLATMSHELRTPLNAIIGFSQILLTRKDVPKEMMHNYVEKIFISGKNLLTLVNTILDFSKIRAGKMEYTPTDTHLAEVMKEVGVLMKPLAGERVQTLTLPDTGDTHLLIDRLLIKQVLINLINNAIRFSPKESHVTVTFDLKDTEVLFSVCDQGSGIKPEEIDTLFEAFIQHDREHTVGGSGLGLAIVKEIIDMHQGKIWVESEPGKGSCFRFTLPSPESTTD